MSRKKVLDPYSVNTIPHKGFKATAWYDHEAEQWSVRVTYDVESLDFTTKSTDKLPTMFRKKVDELIDLSYSLVSPDTADNLENPTFKLYNIYDVATNKLMMTATRPFIQYIFDCSKGAFGSKLNQDGYFKSLEGYRYYVAPRDAMRLYELHRGNINGYKREVMDLEVFAPLPPSLSERLITLTPILGELQYENGLL